MLFRNYENFQTLVEVIETEEGFCFKENRKRCSIHLEPCNHDLVLVPNSYRGNNLLGHPDAIAYLVIEKNVEYFGSSFFMKIKLFKEDTKISQASEPVSAH